jgi:DNA polymerase-3 subunit alpha
LKKEKELLGNYFSGHPLDKFRNEWERATTLDLSCPERAATETRYNLVCMVQAFRVQITKRGTKMGIAVFEDYNGSIEAVMFSRQLEQFEQAMVVDSVIGLICKMEARRDRDTLQMVIEEIRDPGALDEKDAGEVHLRLRPEFVERHEVLHEMACNMFNIPGRCGVYVHVPLNGGAAGGNGKEAVVRAGFAISSRERALASLRNEPCVAEVWKIYPAMLAAARKPKPIVPAVGEDDIPQAVAAPSLSPAQLAAARPNQTDDDEDESDDSGTADDYDPAEAWGEDEGDSQD